LEISFNSYFRLDAQRAAPTPVLSDAEGSSRQSEGISAYEHHAGWKPAVQQDGFCIARITSS